MQITRLKVYGQIWCSHFSADSLAGAWNCVRGYNTKWMGFTWHLRGSAEFGQTLRWLICICARTSVARINFFWGIDIRSDNAETPGGAATLPGSGDKNGDWQILLWAGTWPRCCWGGAQSFYYQQNQLAVIIMAKICLIFRLHGALGLDMVMVNHWRCWAFLTAI